MRKENRAETIRSSYIRFPPPIATEFAQPCEADSQSRIHEFPTINALGARASGWSKLASTPFFLSGLHVCSMAAGVLGKPRAVILVKEGVPAESGHRMDGSEERGLDKGTGR